MTSAALLSLSTLASPPTIPCVSDADCYGGKCLPGGECLCPPLWTGPACQILRLKPARVSTPGLLLPKTSTWGGGAVEEIQKTHRKYHAHNDELSNSVYL